MLARTLPRELCRSNVDAAQIVGQLKMHKNRTACILGNFQFKHKVPPEFRQFQDEVPAE